MRIISGKFKGRRISAPNKLPVRPTTDQAKEGLFNILQNNFDFEDLKVLDLFSGIGSVSLEFVSRGVRHLTAVDMHYGCIGFQKKTQQELDISEINSVKANVFKYLESAQGSYDIIFADPPYDIKNLKELPDAILKQDLLAEDGWLIVEHPKEISFTSHPKFDEHRCYGHVNFSIFR